MTEKLSLKYPIIFVHGLGMRDDIKLLKYWGKIPENLKNKGIKIYLSNQNAFDTIEFNAEILRNRILEILQETNNSKINIIAHSKGGLEARYLISKLNMDEKVATLTTISTPHRGSSLADWVLEKAAEKKALKFSEKMIKTLAIWQGDKSPKILPAFRQLTLNAMKTFNQQIIDSPKVYYQSYGGIINGKPYGIWSNFKRKMIEKREGENDSVVSLKSFQWTNFKGIVKSNTGQGVSHHEIIDLTHFSDFNAPAFYLKIINELAEMGF